MALLKREAILSAQDSSTKDVKVPEWGGSVRVRTMTLAERNQFAVRAAGTENHVSVAAWLFSRLAVDDSGAPLFREEDVPELEKRNFRAVDTVVRAILEVNGMTEKKVEEAGKG